MLFQRSFAVTRIENSTVVPLEVWDVVVNGALLRDARYTQTWSDTLLRAIESLLNGTAKTKSNRILPSHLLKTVKSIYVGGGGSLEPETRKALERASLPVLFSPSGRYLAETGGNELMKKHGKGAGLTIDIGQTAIKIYAAGRRLVLERDFSLLPYPSDARPEDLSIYEEHFQKYLADAMSAAIVLADTEIETAVIAIASKLDKEGTILSGSYAGPIGVKNCIRNALQTCKFWNGAHVILVNDAELAAYTARHECAMASLAPPALVLNLGQGVGASLLLPEMSASRTINHAAA